jgi:hypothetical protein
MSTREITYIDPTTGLPTVSTVEDADLWGSGTTAARPASGDATGDMWLLDDGNGFFHLQRWNGTAWENLMPQIPGGSVYDATGGQVFAGTVTVNLDTVQALSGDGANFYSLAADVVTVAEAGTYLVSYECSLDKSNGAIRCTSRTFLERDSGGGFTLEPGTDSFAYMRNTASGEGTSVCSTILSIAAGDQFRLRASRFSGAQNLVTVANGTRLTFLRVGA